MIHPRRRRQPLRGGGSAHPIGNFVLWIFRTPRNSARGRLRSRKCVGDAGGRRAPRDTPLRAEGTGPMERCRTQVRANAHWQAVAGSRCRRSSCRARDRPHDRSQRQLEAWNTGWARPFIWTAVPRTPPCPPAGPRGPGCSGRWGPCAQVTILSRAYPRPQDDFLGSTGPCASRPECPRVGACDPTWPRSPLERRAGREKAPPKRGP